MSRLDPFKHRNAALVFDRHFEIREDAPKLDFLSRILTCFSQIPYENLSKVIKYRDHFHDAGKLRFPVEVVHDHIRHRLGGTCFSLTTLLQTILTRHGFLSYRVLADMRWGRGVHCALIVLLEGGAYLVDPGYLLNRPMEIGQEVKRHYRTSHTGVQLTFDAPEEAFDLYTFDREEMKWRYRFKNQPVSDETFMEHWLDSFRWNSMHALCLTRVQEERMVYIHKHHYRETTFEGRRKRNIRDCIHQTVRSEFGIDAAWVEEAISAIDANMVKERESGLWLPGKRRRETNDPL